MSNATRKPVQTPRSPLKVRMWTFTFTPSRIQRWSSPRGLPSCTETRKEESAEYEHPLSFPELITKTTHPSPAPQGSTVLWQPHCGNRKAQWAIRLLQATHTGMRQDSTTMWINHVHGYHPKVSPVHPTVYDSKMHHHLKPFWAKKKYHTKCTQQVDSSHSVSCKTMFFRITLVSHISSSSPSKHQNSCSYVWSVSMYITFIPAVTDLLYSKPCWV